MLSNEPARLRLQARECIVQAERSMDPREKGTWLKVAAEWIRLARSIDDRLGKRPE
jgi:hypothetical protein